MRVVRVVDLSIPLGPGTPVYPGDPAPATRQATRLETHGYNVLALELGSHTGTHVDAPYHLLAGGDRLEDLDLGAFVGPGVVADVRGHEPRSPIAWRELEPYAERLRAGTILALRTGWSDEHLGADRYFEHPFLDPDACSRVLELGVRTLAVDALSPDPTDGGASDLPVHRLVLGAGGVIVENLTNLGSVGVPDPVFSFAPIRLAGDADGAPCRAIALEVEPG